MAKQIPDDRSLLEGIGLSFAEAALLCEALRALWLSPKFIERTWREMREVIRTEHLEEKWGTPADVLLKRCAGLRLVSPPSRRQILQSNPAPSL